VRAAAGDVAGAVAVLEEAVDGLEDRRVPWLRASLLIDLARLRAGAGDEAGATIDARAAASTLAGLDVVVAPADADLLERLVHRNGDPPRHASTATLSRDGKGWTASHAGTRVRLADTKGLRYLAELVACPGIERHALDLVDRIEGIDPAGVDRRSIGGSGAVLDTSARVAYRRRIEVLRSDADDALAAGQLELAEAAQAELDVLVRQLAQAFGLGGRAREAGSAAERARLNVTRAVRAAIARVADGLPTAGAVLDRRVRTGLYCSFEPAADDEVRWIVQSGVNDTFPT
jgi:hypothetical protein